MDVDIVMASKKEIQAAVDKMYATSGEQESLADLIRDGDDELETVERGADASVNEPELTDEEGQQVVKIVTTLIHEAIARGASDIHLEPQETHLKLRYRIDGDLQLQPPIPARLMPQILSRIKLLSKMDIAEKRKPLDGRFTVRYKGSEVDLRVSSFPVSLRKRGVCEKIVMRILDPNSGQFPLREMGFDPRVLKQFLEAINLPNGIILVTGPTGSGKTTAIKLACEKLGIPCSVYDMGSMYDPVSGLLGVHRLQKGGESVFDYAKFTQDIQKPGVILLDELSRAPVTTNNILFPCLDSRRMLPVEMAGGDELRSIPVHPDCVFVATANVGAEYTGTMSLDRALVGRFFPLELDYMPLDCEVQVLTKRCGILPADAENIASVAGTVRSLYGKQEISCTISTRETLAAARLVADGWSSLEAMELTFLPLFEGTRTEGERGVVAKIFMTR